ncbi:hypothetical protein GCM10007927_09600 [Sulfitobacter pacificus]|uniref:Uncharacterized protein n=1 Tax=Sulfitobacter pacificus TaxID=1499314 RepID=A0ABQ5VGF9_9RHOB|nr:hypothetical protein GCM10007927_09600 [Sulfitobacter pacificus]
MRSELDTWRGVANVRARCEAQAVEEGLAGLELFFRSQNLFMEAINAQPTYRERQAAWAAEQASKNPPKSDPIVEALRQIAGGHNDPRKLALDVLSAYDSKEGQG